MQQPPAAPGATPSPEVLPPGTVLLNRYRILSFIGGGGFGSIYEVLDLALGHRRAIKEAFGLDPQAQHQFRLEAEFLLNVQHPNLVRGYAVFEQANKLYLVMEYVDGQTLEDIAIDYIRRTGRALPEEQVVEWMIPVCDAVFALHAQPVPIIHRDVKPANIKLSQSHGPVLIDLGLAKLHIQGQNTIRAALAFTPGYAPPEQYRASGATDRRTDIYGLGATLFYLFTGYQPTEAPARLSAQALPMPRTLNTLLSPASEAIVLKSMALDPAERYQDARAMAADLQQALAALRASRGGSAYPDAGMSGAQPAVLGVTSGKVPAVAPAGMRGGSGAFPVLREPGSASPGAPVYGQHGNALHNVSPQGSPRAATPERGGVISGPVCAQCGVVNPGTARFCMRCGAGLHAETSDAGHPITPFDRPTDLRPALARGERPGAYAAYQAPGQAPGQAQRQTPQRAPGLAGAAQGRNQQMRPQPVFQRYRSPAPRLSPAGVGIAHGGHAPRQVPLSGPIASAAKAIENVIPGTVVALERMHARYLALRANQQELDAWTSILSMLAVACLALSLMAAFTRGMLIFVVPALILGHLSLALREATPPREFRILALVAVGCGYAWVILFLAIFIFSR